MKHARLVVTIAGIPTTVLQADTAHGVKQPIGTCTLTFPAPIPTHITRNAVVEVQAGFDETIIATIFSGRIVSRHAEYDDSGKTARVDCNGWADLLSFKDQRDLVYYNASRPWAIFRSICTRRGVPRFQADNMRYSDGVTDIRLGGNSFVQNGNVIIPRTQSPLDWLATKCGLFEYYIFDRPDGMFHLQLINGIPPSATATYVEAVDLVTASHDDTLDKYVTYWEALGATYTDGDGVNVAIRSIPAVVPYSADLDPPGYRADSVSDSDIVSQTLADAVRNAKEVAYGAPAVTETFEIEADPTLLPGMAIHLTSATLGIDDTRWLMAIRQTVSSDRGYWATIDTWSGGGTALAAGNDCVTTSVLTGPVHLGDETISWYAHPSPQGHVYSVDFSVGDYYTSITVRGRAHGCNSFLIGGTNTTSTVSQFEIWQAATKVGSGQLPTLAENYSEELDYTNDANWSNIVIPISGSLVAGTATLKILSGNDSRATAGPWDDFELKNLTITTCGVGQPTLPTEQL